MRKLVKHQMVIDRGGYPPPCDLCGNIPGMDMHEIVSRGRTVGNKTAREYSYAKELCALLCQPCHAKAHTKAVREQLLQKNIERYGYTAVEEAFQRVRDSLHTGLDIEMPLERIVGRF